MLQDPQSVVDGSEDQAAKESKVSLRINSLMDLKRLSNYRDHRCSSPDLNDPYISSDIGQSIVAFQNR
ncbi:hypothetical protein Trydic_g968 [Trypoxylus dichotomus]